MTDRAGKPVINIADVTLHPRPSAFAATGDAAQRYDARMGMIGSHIGARLLGYNITAVPPGRRAFPLHNHLVNEEMFFVLEGRGELRLGDATHAVRSGDVNIMMTSMGDTINQFLNDDKMEVNSSTRFGDTGYIMLNVASGDSIREKKRAF